MRVGPISTSTVPAAAEMFDRSAWLFACTKAALALALISLGCGAPNALGKATSAARRVALGVGSPALALATKAGALAESSGPALADRAVARRADPDATSEAPASVGAARSRFAVAPIPAMPASPRANAICAGCGEGWLAACEATASAGLSTGAGEAVNSAVAALRCGLTAGAACGFTEGTAAVCALVEFGRAACNEGLDDGDSSANGFCATIGPLVVCRATEEELGRTSAGTDATTGAASEVGVASVAFMRGAAVTMRRWLELGDGVWATTGDDSAGRRRWATRDPVGESPDAGVAGDGSAAVCTASGAVVACRATAVLLGRGVVSGVAAVAPGVVVGWACVLAAASS
jgi:hypothetical protein